MTAVLPPPPELAAPNGAALDALPGAEEAGCIWRDEQVAEAIAQFDAGNYSQSRALAVEAMQAARTSPAGAEDGGRSPSAPRAASGRSDPMAYADWQVADSWKDALDAAAGAHEDAGDPDRAEGLYLRMLAWREGLDQYRQGHLFVAQQLFEGSPSYTSVEDATWVLKGLQPEDGHAVPDVIGLLALGEDVATKAAVALWTLALRPQQRIRISERGGLELVAKAVAYYVDNPELQAAGLGALRLLCAGHPLAQHNRRTLLTRLGGAEAAAASLHAHRADPEVQREGCSLLRVLAGSPPGARRVLDCGGIGLCLSAVTECPTWAVSEAACALLKSLQRASEASPRAGDAAAEDVEAVVEARLRAEREAGLSFVEERLASLMQSAPDGGDRVQQQSLLSFAGVFLADEGVRSRALGLFDPVLLCMQRYAGFQKVQVTCTSILWQLITGHIATEEASARLAQGGIAGAVCQAMRDLPLCVELQRVAAGVLMHVTKYHNDHKTAGVRAGAIPAVITAMRGFPEDAVLQQRSIAALTNLCDTIGRSTACVRQGGIELVLAALRRHGDTGRVAELALVILCMFCDDHKLRHQVSQAGGAAAAKRHIASQQPGVRRWAGELYKELSDGPVHLPE